MITVLEIWFPQGFSSADHLLDDGELQSLIGRRFASVARARSAVRRIEREHPQETAGCRLVPVRAVVSVAGSALEVTL